MNKNASRKVIVIGSGLGGLSAAISLAAEGFQVEVYEKNERIGGKLNVMKKEGFSFDLGPSILILPYLFRRLFEKTGRRMEDYVQIEELKTHWRNFFEDGMVIDLCSDMADMEAQLAKLPPNAGDGYYSYMDYSRKLWNFANEAYFSRGADYLTEVTKGYNPFELKEKTDLFSTMAQGVSRYIEEPHLQYIMNFFIKYVGSSAYDAPAIYNLLAYSQMGYGLWYVTGGMYNLALGLERYMRDIGIPVHLNSEVIEIRKADSRVEGVLLRDGEFKPADIVVSNMEVIPAYERLLGEKGFFMERYRRQFEPSCSGLVIHLGVKGEYPQLQHHNFFFAKDQKHHFDMVYRDKKMPKDPTIYLVAPTRTDKTIAPPDHEIIKILPHIPHIQNPPFTRGDYEDLKNRLYVKLERMGLHNLRKRIVVEDMLVPEDIERMYYSNKGSIYGIVASLTKNLGFRAPKRSKLYKNLYFVGGSVNPGSGMPMVIYSGQMIKDKIVEDLNK